MSNELNEIYLKIDDTNNILIISPYAIRESILAVGLLITLTTLFMILLYVLNLDKGTKFEISNIMGDINLLYAKVNSRIVCGILIFYCTIFLVGVSEFLLGLIFVESFEIIPIFIIVGVLFLFISWLLAAIRVPKNEAFRAIQEVQAHDFRL